MTQEDSQLRYMKVYVLGNPLVAADSLPLKLLPKLRNALPDIEFIETDPTENFIPEANSIIVDTVLGITKVTRFNSIDEFEILRSVTAHDYDLSLHLQLLKKLGKLKEVKIIGIPVKGNQQIALKKSISVILNLFQDLMTSDAETSSA